MCISSVFSNEKSSERFEVPQLFSGGVRNRVSFANPVFKNPGPPVLE